ncbi:MAG: penicillin-binding transpeptidase domain-containing protein [Leptospiraceae bacterium]|nr:penicillin-binding transpeptidase domain-containing protein [Leptospiraceae bacterium]MDW7976278.1 penicillin-binding transpeptidase domain-containing protein [Leptospiraceae bacterium]
MSFDLNKSQRRLFFVVGIFIFLFVVVFIRIIYLSEIFQENKPREGTKKILRGSILDRKGMSLAITEEASTIGINPKEIMFPEKTAKLLAGYLNLDANGILQKLYLHQNRNYFLLERRIDNYVAELILDLRLPGVYRDFEYKRVYPANRLASNLIGFVQNDTMEGIAGIEKYYEDVLTTPDDIHKGVSIQLTIDSFLQNELEKVLIEFYEKSKASKAIGILMDNESGEILAMANIPNYNPNEYYKEDAIKKSNWAISYAIEPGSLMKPFFAAMLINEKPDITEKYVHCDGEYHFKTGSIRCLRDGKIVAHGKVNLEKIIEVSCNVGIAQLTKELSKEQILKYLTEFGFGNPTGVVPERFEHSGYVPKLSNWVESHYYYLPIGQGMSATPIQILAAFNALVSNVWIRPILVKAILSEKKGVLERSNLVVKNLSLRRKTTDEIKHYLSNVVEKGTGKLAKVDFLSVIGKTGSAQKSTPFGYSDYYTVSFVGAFPYPKLKYSLLIIFDDVGPSYTGGSLAAPAFSKFLTRTKNYLFSPVKNQKVLITKDLSEKIDFKDLEGSSDKIPNFEKRSLKEILYWKSKVLDVYNENQKTKITLEIYGSGYVTKQIPPPGTVLKETKKIQLYLSKDVHLQ